LSRTGRENQLNQTAAPGATKENVLRRLNGSEVPMWIFDRETLEILEVNHAAVLAYGYSREQFLRQTIVVFHPPEAVAAILHKTLQPKLAGPSTNELWTHRRADGSAFRVRIDSEWLTWNGRPAELVIATPL
jgi:PAS domain S-box-containing protein